MSLTGRDGVRRQSLGTRTFGSASDVTPYRRRASWPDQGRAGVLDADEVRVTEGFDPSRRMAPEPTAD
jgi:hypothetical protein